MKLAVLFLMMLVVSMSYQLQQRMMWMLSPMDAAAALHYQNNLNNYNKYYSHFPIVNQQEPNMIAINSPSPFSDDYKEEQFMYDPTPVMTHYRPPYYSSPSAAHQWFIAVSGNGKFKNNLGSSSSHPYLANQHHQQAERWQNNNNADGIGYVISQAELFDDHQEASPMQGMNEGSHDHSWLNNMMGIDSRRVARPPALRRPSSAPALLGPTQMPVEQRLFWPSLGIQIISNTSQYRPFAQTVGIVTTQTVNITSVITCIASNQFISLFSTCSRRKRAAIERFRLPDEEDDSSVNPSTVLKIETTVSPKLTEQELMEESNVRLNELVTSSKDDFILIDSQEELMDKPKDVALSSRSKRFFWYTSTTTLTSYVFTTTIAYKKISLLSSVQSSSLVCIPSGFVACTFFEC